MPVPAFYAHVESLCALGTGAGAAAACPGVVGRTWAVPTGYPVGVPPYDPAGFATALDRTTVNYYVVDAYQTGAQPNAGRTGEVIAGKLALDHMAVRERALQARHATPQRLRAWAAARRAGHGDATYGVFGAFAAQVADAQAAAEAYPNAQG